MKETLLIIQPNLAKYRIPVWVGLCEFYNTHILCSKVSSSDGFGNLNYEERQKFSSVNFTRTIYLGNRFFFQTKILKTIRFIKPDKILVCGATNDFGFWLLLIYSKIRGEKLFVHTQGPFNKNSKSFFYRFIYKVIVNFSYKVVLYTKFSFEKLQSFNLFSDKICYANNTLELPSLEINFEKKHYNPGSLKLLFIGRIRSGSGLYSLLNFIQNNNFFEINIIGEGVHYKELRKKFSNDNVKWHGAIFSSSQIQKISNQCHFGVYPGNAGLSVVHYLSLNLPVIIHDNLSIHQGPEPSYIIDKFNGFKFKNSDDKSNLFEMLSNIYNNFPIADYHKMQSNVNKTFYDLSFPSYSQKLFKILDE